MQLKCCGMCENYTGMHDWNLCCKERQDPKEFPFGHLCYEDTPACGKFKPKESPAPTTLPTEEKIDKIDFVLRENGDETLIFRFRPQRSACHSFNENPPKTWKDVYKVYYSYEILKTWKGDDDVDVLFDSSSDECSIIDLVADVIKHIVNGKKSCSFVDGERIVSYKLLNNEMRPFGDGVSWTIKKCRQRNEYEFVLWNWNDTGYRFCLHKDKLKAFGEYLNECCEYMLAHGEPI